ncbi:MAG: energy transducer TonB [Bacteroidota bacterium]|nr:energy transducer TonB [Bacteroidota bacterium]
MSKKSRLIFTLPVLPGLLFALCCSFTAQPGATNKGQVATIERDTLPVTDTAAEMVFEKVEIEASFTGGAEAWIKFLENNLNAGVATDNSAPDGHYTVIIQFVVDKEGKVSNIKALTRHSYGMEAEVIRLLKKAPRWNPAIQDGRTVKAYRKQPVTFVVISEKKKKKNKD